MSAPQPVHAASGDRSSAGGPGVPPADASALRAVEDALALSPRDGLLLRHRADVLWYLDRFDEAIDAYEQAIAVDPLDTLSIVGRKECLAALGRHVEVVARH